MPLKGKLMKITGRDLLRILSPETPEVKRGKKEATGFSTASTED
jgi:hypothetical protein